MAIQKWMDCQIVVTRSKVNKLAIMAWASAVFLMLSEVIAFSVLDEAGKILATEISYVISAVLPVCSLAAIVYFYVMVYLGVRKRNLSTQVTAKLENKVAKTMGLLTAAVIGSFVPPIVSRSLGGVFQIIWEPSAFSLSMLLVYLNSVVNILIYCYRDRRFRNAVLELLGIRKPQANQPAAVAAPPFVRPSRKDPVSSLEGAFVELQNVEIPAGLTRSASCDLALVLDSAHLATLKRSLPVPSLAKGINSCE